MGGGLANRRYRPRHDGIHAQLSQFSAGAARIAVYAVGIPGFGARPQAIHPHLTRIQREHERGVGKAGVRADFLVAKTPVLERLHIFSLGNPVVFLDGMRPHGCRGPFPVQPFRDRLGVRLIIPMVSQKHNIPKTVKLEASCRVFENLLKCFARHGDCPRKTHVRRRRLQAAFRNVGQHRRHQRIAQRERNFSDSAFTRALCLPSAMCGPFCSVPPMGTMTLVFPDRTWSCNSVQVRSSRNTVLGVWACAPGGASRIHKSSRALFIARISYGIGDDLAKRADAFGGSKVGSSGPRRIPRHCMNCSTGYYLVLGTSTSNCS